MRQHYDWLIVGAGFTGAVLAERIATQSNKSCLVIDRRDHIAGNAFDTRNDAGILYHRYGPHIFHTNSAAVFNYLSRFTEWRKYEHRVLGLIDGRTVPIPFNLTSIEILFPEQEAKALIEVLTRVYGVGNKVSILDMRQSSVPQIQMLADFIYQKVFYGYTLKQWGLKPEELSYSVTGRVPVHISYDDRYFQDKYQFMPSSGYTAMFSRMLSHPSISLFLKTEIQDLSSSISYDRIIYSGAIDEYFCYRFGSLPYRSLDISFQTYRQKVHQASGQVNYPNCGNFTRITEMSYLTGETSAHTTVSIEYPVAHRPGETIPFYPVPAPSNLQLYAKYAELARREAKNVIFAGRLGDYKYYNMDQAVGRALSIFNKQINPL